MGSQFALVWLVMKGNRYLKGASISAYSARLTKTSCSLVLMVTNDVKVGDEQKRVFDEIVSVDYVTTNNKAYMSQKQKKKYSKWMNVSCTKWECLKLVQYKKVIFVDADIVIHKNIDHLFELNAPAARFYNYMIDGRLNKLKHRVTINPVFMYNNLIKTKPKKYTKTNHTNYTLNGGFVILEPNMKMHNKMLELCKQKLIYDNVSSIDECVISFLYTIFNISWTNLDKMYNCEVWKDKDYKKASVLHYIGSDLPWESDEIKYEDVKLYKKYQKSYTNFVNSNINDKHKD